MATVRFSKELTEQILKNAEAMFHRQIEAAENSRPSHDWGMKIYNTMFGEYIPTINALPSHFFRRVDTIPVERIGETQCRLDFNLPVGMAWPYTFVETAYAKQGSQYSLNLSLKDHLAWGELFAEIKAWKERIDAAKERQRTFTSAVKQVLEAHATLAPALKMWPPLWDLVPEQYKDKHREVKERTKRDVDVDVDLGHMTAVAAFIKMTK